MGDTIINNRIAGTRITVWDITYYLEKGRSAENSQRDKTGARSVHRKQALDEFVLHLIPQREGD